MIDSEKIEKAKAMLNDLFNVLDDCGGVFESSTDKMAFDMLYWLLKDGEQPER